MYCLTLDTLEGVYIVCFNIIKVEFCHAQCYSRGETGFASQLGIQVSTHYMHRNCQGHWEKYTFICIIKLWQVRLHAHIAEKTNTLSLMKLKNNYCIDTVCLNALVFVMVAVCPNLRSVSWEMALMSSYLNRCFRVKSSQ